MRFKVEHHAIIRTIAWLVIAALVLETFAVVGFFTSFARLNCSPGLAWRRGLQASSWSCSNMSSSSGGPFVPKFLAVGEDAKPALAVLASTLNGIRLTAATIGNNLIVGVAVPIFALASLSIPQVPKAIGWLGILVGVLKWLPLHYWPDGHEGERANKLRTRTYGKGLPSEPTAL